MPCPRLPFLLLIFALLGCAPAAAPSVHVAAAAPSASAPAAPPPDPLPPGAPAADAYVRLAGTLDLTFARFTLRSVDACDSRPDSRVALLDVDWASPHPFGSDEWEGDLVDSTGKVAGKATTGGIGCGDDFLPGAKTKHLRFDASLAASWLVLTVEEPHGFGRTRVAFALRPEVYAGITMPKPAAHAPAPSPHLGEPVETAYYRITPLRLVYCGYTMYANDLWAAEIAVDNLSNVPLSFPVRAAMVDDKGRKFDQNYREQGDCSPALDATGLAPGASARGFLWPVEVPRGVERVDLLYSVTSRQLLVPSDVHVIHAGALPLAALRGKWEPPATPSTSGPGYRVTVTSVRRCTTGASGKDYVGVELLVEDTSTTEGLMGNFNGTLEDSASYRVEVELDGKLTECEPSVGNPFELKPGQKVRGWLGLFLVPPTSGPWTLHYKLDHLAPDGRLGGDVVVDLPVGKLAL